MTERGFWANKKRTLSAIYGTGSSKALELISVANQRELAIAQAGIEGIPNADHLVSYYDTEGNPEEKKGDRDLAWLNERFKNVISMRGHIWRRAALLNKVLYHELVKPIVRGPHKYGKEIEEYNVPDRYYHEISPTSTPVGWSAPRLLLLLIEDIDGNVVGDIKDTFPILDEAITNSDNEYKFLAVLSEKLFEKDVEGAKIIDLVLKHHSLKEQNNKEMYFQAIDFLKSDAPKLFAKVEELYAEPRKGEIPGWVKILDLYNTHRNTSTEETTS